MRRSVVFAWTLAACLAWMTAAAESFAPAVRTAAVRLYPKSCPRGFGRPWHCAVVSVPLDHSGRVPGRVRLAVALRHRPGPPRPAVLALAGGPGSAALPTRNGFAARLGPLLAGRDLLVVDQRGTGASDPLDCPTIDPHEAWSPRDVRRCAARLRRRGAFAGTDDSVHDLESVRAALHIPRLAVYGISYGSKVAVDYARAAPTRVDALVLDSPIVEDTDPFYRRSAVGAARVLANQCRERRCAPGTDPVADLRTLVRRMRDGVLPADAQITEGRILHRIVEGGGPLHRLPAALHAAVQGDPGPLAAMLPAIVPDARDPDWLRSGWSRTVYLTTSCEDGDFPWARSAAPGRRRAAVRHELDRLGDRAFTPFDRAVGEQYGAQKICVPWPWAGRRPPPAPVPDVPALLLVGGDDDIAPLEGAREIAAGLPQSRTVVVAGAGHGVLRPSGPAARALRSFAAGLGS